MNLILASKIGGVICAIGGVTITVTFIPWSGNKTMPLSDDKTIPLPQDKVFVYAVVRKHDLSAKWPEVDQFQCKVVAQPTEQNLFVNTSDTDMFNCELSTLPKIDITNTEINTVDVKEHTNKPPNKNELNTAYNTFQIKSYDKQFWNKLSTANSAIQIVSKSNTNKIYAILFPIFAKYQNSTKIFREIYFIGKSSVGQAEKLSIKQPIAHTMQSDGTSTTEEALKPKIFNCVLGGYETEICAVVGVSDKTSVSDYKNLLFKPLYPETEPSLEKGKYYLIWFMQYVLPKQTESSLPKPLPTINQHTKISLYERQDESTVVPNIKNDVKKIEFTDIIAVSDVQGYLNIL